MDIIYKVNCWLCVFLKNTTDFRASCYKALENEEKIPFTETVHQDCLELENKNESSFISISKTFTKFVTWGF